MIRKGRAVVMVVAVAGLSGACGSTGSVGQAVTNNTAVRQDTAAMQKVVQGCITAGDPLTSGGRTSILNCIAPPGHLKAFETCAQAKIGTDGLLTSADRRKLYQDWAVCLQNNR